MYNNQQQGNNYNVNNQNFQNQGYPNSYNQYPKQPNNIPIQQNPQSYYNNEDYQPSYQQNNISYPGQNSDMTIQIDSMKPNQQKDDFLNNGMELLGKNTRMGFVRKVYGILSVQLLITIIFCVITMTSDSFANFQRKHYWLAIICGVFSMVIVIILMCFRSQSKKVPTNYILLFSFTIFEAYLVSYCCSAVSNQQTVLIAAILTGTITIVLTLFAFFTKTDYTRWYHVLGIVFMAVIMVTFFCIFWRVSCPVNPQFFFYNIIIKVLNIIICGAIAILYGFYLLVDTQMIAGGKKYELSYDDYIIGALLLYVDIIGIFIYLLSMLGSSN